MARILLSVYNFIVLISFVQCSSSTTATLVAPSPTTTNPGSSPTSTTNGAPASATATATANAIGNSFIRATSAVLTSSANGTTTSNTSQIAPTTSGNVSTSSSVPTASTKRFKARVTVDATYESAYNNINSQKSQDFINTFTANVTAFLNGQLTGNINIEVKNLTNGSVVVDFDIIAPQSSSATESTIKQALKEGNENGSLGYTLIGDITVTEVQKPTAPTTSGNVPTSSSVPTASTKRFKARVTVDATYESDYDNIKSAKSQAFIKNFTGKVTSYLNGQLTGNISIEVKNLTNGSVVVDFDIIAPQSSNATESTIKQTLKEGSEDGILGYTLIGDITVTEVQKPTVTSSSSAPVTKATTAPPTSSTKGTEIWDKAIDMATPMGTFIIVVVAVALIIILLIALICVCCKYRNLKKKTHFPDHMAINDSEWIRSNDDLLMWERNLRASEVKTTNGVSNRPINDKRT